MTRMTALTAGTLGAARTMTGLVLPVFGNPTDFDCWSKRFRAIVCVLLIGGTCYGLLLVLR